MKMNTGFAGDIKTPISACRSCKEGLRKRDTSYCGSIHSIGCYGKVVEYDVLPRVEENLAFRSRFFPSSRKWTLRIGVVCVFEEVIPFIC